MAQVAIFHSALGVRDGELDAATRLESLGHSVALVDQYEGRTFSDYAEATDYVNAVGFPGLMDSAVQGVELLPDGFACLGFSNGGGMAEHVALTRRTAGLVIVGGALPLPMLGAETWPSRTPVQIHSAAGDPFRQDGWVEALAASVRATGAVAEVFEYAGNGHLFTDPGRIGEFDAEGTELFWKRAAAFFAGV